MTNEIVANPLPLLYSVGDGFQGVRISVNKKGRPLNLAQMILFGLMMLRVSYRGGYTGIPPPPPPPPRILKLTSIFLILSILLIANFQPFWSPRSHQKHSPPPPPPPQNFTSEPVAKFLKFPEHHVFFPTPTEKFCMKLMLIDRQRVANRIVYECRY